MESIESIRTNFRFTDRDQENLRKIGELIAPNLDSITDEFYDYLTQNPKTAKYFQSEKAIQHRKETFKGWLTEVFASKYDHQYLLRLQKVGKIHVKIGLKGYYVDGAMTYVRELLRQQVSARVKDGVCDEELLTSLHKALDINLSALTSSYQEEKLNNLFLSQNVESKLVSVAGRMLYGLNLILVTGLLAMALGVVGLLCMDIYTAFTDEFYYGMIKALGSLLLLWMMIELLHTEIDHLQGGHFQVKIFVELALVAFIRKVFVASFKTTTPLEFALPLIGLFVLGIIYFFVARVEKPKGRHH